MNVDPDQRRTTSIKQENRELLLEKRADGSLVIYSSDLPKRRAVITRSEDQGLYDELHKAYLSAESQARALGILRLEPDDKIILRSDKQ